MKYVNKLWPNTYEIKDGSERYFLMLNSSVPFIDKDGKIVCNVVFTKPSDEKIYIQFSASFSFLITNYYSTGTLAHEYLLNQTKIEIERETGVDFSDAFIEIAKLHVGIS